MGSGAGQNLKGGGVYIWLIIRMGCVLFFERGEWGLSADNPIQSCRWLKVSACMSFYCTSDFQSQLSQKRNFQTSKSISPFPVKLSQHFTLHQTNLRSNRTNSSRKYLWLSCYQGKNLSQFFWPNFIKPRQSKIINFAVKIAKFAAILRWK